MSVEQPLVSVVIPTYNYGHYVTEAVESALAQTYPAVEVIVIDDGSTDDTRDRLSRFDGRIRYIYQDNAGLSAARNRGIEASKGHFVAFLDSDDAFHPRKIEIQMAFFRANPELGLLGTRSFSDEKRAWSDYSTEGSTIKHLSLSDIILRARFGPSSVVARLECFQKVGYFDTHLRSVEDRDMWIRIGMRFPVARVQEFLTWYRITPGSMSRNPQRMEHYEILVLRRSFSLPELANKRRLKHYTFAHAYFSCAVMYASANQPWATITRLLRSVLWYPWLHRCDVNRSFSRPRLFITATFKLFGVLKLLGLKRRI